jgi:hypothetical protein
MSTRGVAYHEYMYMYLGLNKNGVLDQRRNNLPSSHGSFGVRLLVFWHDLHTNRSSSCQIGRSVAVLVALSVARGADG